MNRRLLSPTAINTYLHCPRKYYLKYIKRLRDRPSIHLLRGLTVHQAIARFHRLDMTAFPSMEDMQVMLVGFFNEYWQSRQAGLDRLGLPEAVIKRFYIESKDMLRGWIARYLDSPITGLDSPKTEVKIISKTHGVMGVIDAIHDYDGRIALVDYKTSFKDDITPAIKVQLAIYALLYFERYRVRPDIVAVDFLKTQTQRRFRATERLIQYAKDLCSDMYKKTASTREADYPCTCGGWCRKDFITQNGGR